MPSPATLHFQRVSAALAAAKVDPGQSMTGLGIYDTHLVKLRADRARLKQFQSIEAKIKVKREILPDYQEYVAGVLEAGRGGQDDVLATILVWRIDVEDYAGALDIARYVIRHKLTLPDEFSRTPAAILAEEIAKAAQKAMDTGGKFDPDQLGQVLELIDGHDMPDQVRAKLLKALGYALLKKSKKPAKKDQARALEAWREALRLDSNVGLKRTIADLEKQVSISAAGNSAGGE
jgi:hypothetical protein